MGLTSAVVLAAGEGRRLRPLTKHRPKPMLPAANRPILEYVFDALVDAGIEALHVVVGYGQNRVQNHFGPTYRDRTITYHEQEKQLGTGHALLQARDAIDEDFLVVNGDEVVTTELVETVIDAHSIASTATLAVVERQGPPQYGAVRMTSDRIVELVENPSEDEYRLQNRGVYVLGPSIFPAIEETERRDGEIPLTDAIADLIDRTSEVQGVRAPGIWSEATYPWNLLTVARDIMTESLIGLPEPAAQTWIAETATVHDSAILQPPVIVDDDAVVGPGSIVGPYTALGTNVTVQAGSVIRRSVLDSHSRVGTNATVLDSVTGEGTEIGAGVTIPDGPGAVQIDDTVHQDCDLGSVVADRATLGGAVSVAPGTLVGPHATVGHGTHIDANVADGAEVRR